MAVNTSEPLQEHIHRAQIGEQNVRVNVERLFQSLCSDDDQSPIAPPLAQFGFHGLVQQFAILGGEPAVMERGATFNAQAEALSATLKQLAVHPLGLLDRVAYHQHLGPSFGFRQSLGSD